MAVGIPLTIFWGLEIGSKRLVDPRRAGHTQILRKPPWFGGANEHGLWGKGAGQPQDALQEQVRVNTREIIFLGREKCDDEGIAGAGAGEEVSRVWGLNPRGFVVVDFLKNMVVVSV